MSAEHEQAQARIDSLMGISGFFTFALIGQRAIETSLIIDLALTVMLAVAILATIVEATKRAGLID